jgi:serine protease AprX
VAYGAKLLSLRVLGQTGTGRTSDVIAALNWCIRYKNTFNIRVINLSLGHPVFESYKTDPLCRAVEICIRRGIVVLAAAGNYGKDESGNRVFGGDPEPGQPSCRHYGRGGQHLSDCAAV